MPSDDLRPPAPPVPAPPGAARRALSALRLPAMLGYSALAAVFSLWLASFAPAEGPPLARYFPENAVCSVHLRSGVEFFQNARGHPAILELLNDPDFNALLLPYVNLEAHADARIEAAVEERLREQYEKLPPPVRYLFPASAEGVEPLAGGECAAVCSPTGADSRKPGWLFFIRVTGARGLLARLGVRWAGGGKRAAFFDFGGGLLAVGLNGARPASAPALEGGSPAAVSDDIAARVAFHPQRAWRRASPDDGEKTRGGIQYELLAGPLGELGETDAFVKALLQALSAPPGVAEIFHIREATRAVRLELLPGPGGALAARGRVEGGVPPLPAAPLPGPAPDGGTETVFAEGLLPFDARAAFIFHLSDAMRIRREAEMLSKDQRRWTSRLGELRDRNVNLDRDLFPAFGGALHFTVGPTTPDLTATAFGLLRAHVQFDGGRSGAKYAAAELARERWDFLFDGKPTEKPPFVLRVRDGEREGFVLALNQITPVWTISQGALSLVSDGGPFARIEPERAFAVAPPPAAAKPAPAYYLRVDGARMAPAVEAWTAAYFGGMEENLGAREFMERYPDAPLRIVIARKLAGLLGKFSVEVAPLQEAGCGSISAEWLPGSLVIPEAKKEVESAPPPASPEN